MPASSASIKVVHSFNYRGATKQWSTRHHFTNDAPTTAGRWLTFSDAVVNAEKLTMRTDGTIIGTYGYAAGSDVPVYSKTYTTAGTLSITGIQPATGDSVRLLRYSTATRTSKNHPLYLFNYMHGASINNAGDGDTGNVVQGTALSTYGAAWITGFSDGTVNHIRCGPNGDVATGSFVNLMILHRDFPRG